MNGNMLVCLIWINRHVKKKMYVGNSGESLPDCNCHGGQSMESDVLYFGRRASEERRAALRAAHPSVRQAHLDMAQRYDELVNAMTERNEMLGLSQTSAA